MVATVLGLRFRTLRHQLQREWWRGLMLVGGAIWALALLPGVMWAARTLSTSDPEVRATAVIVISVLLLIGWITVPVLITGLDDTLDPGRFAIWGLAAKRIMPGLTVAAFLTLPTLFCTVLLVIMAMSWGTDGVAVTTVAVVGALGIAALLVFSARVSVMWMARLLASRRGRLLGMMLGALVVLALVPVAYVMIKDGIETVIDYDLQVALRQAALTPLGAGASAPVAYLAGDTWGAVWRLSMLWATVAVLHFAWRANVVHALVHPVYRGGGSRRRDDAILGAAERYSRSNAAMVAVRTRVLLAWFSDPRYVSNLVGTITAPLIFLVLVVPVAGLSSSWAFGAPLLLAATIGWGRHNDVALDSSALWLDIVSGHRGRPVMRGRIAATAVWAAPLIVVVSLGVLLWTGRWALAPALIATCLGVLAVSLSISALASVIMPYRAPAPGENPFGAEVGSIGASLVAQLASSAATVLVLPLMVLPFWAAVAIDEVWGLATVALGLIVGPLAYHYGVRAAGSVYDRRSGALIGAIT